MSLRSLCVLLLLSIPIRSQNFTSPIRVNPGLPGTPQKAPVVRCDVRGTVYVSWIDCSANPDGDIVFAISTDGGRTFSPPVTVSAGGSVNADYQRRANFVVDLAGEIHFVWLENRVNNQPDIFYSRSIDTGRTFTAPVAISGDSSKWAQDFPSIALGPGGEIFVCFLDSREAQSRQGANVQLYFTKSTDGGNTFTQARRISRMPGGRGGTCECCTTDMAVSPTGDIGIAFRSNIDNRRDIFVTRSTDGGANFETAIPAQSEQWILGACPVTGPRIAFDAQGTAHAVWRDTRPSAMGMDRIYHTLLPRGAAACPPDLRISDTPDWSNYPDIAITDEGGMLVVFQDGRGSTISVRAAWSPDGGNSFLPSAKIADEQSPSQQTLACCTLGPDGTRYVVWQDTRRDAGDIAFSKDTTRLSVVKPEPVTLLSPPDAASLGLFTGFEWTAPPNLPAARAVRYEVAYRNGPAADTIVVFDRTRLDRALAPGTYWWSVQALTSTGSSRSAEFSFTLSPPASISRPDMHPALALACHPLPVLSGQEATLQFVASGEEPAGLSQARPEEILLNVCDATGREVLRERHMGSTRIGGFIRFPTAGFAPGFFIARVTVSSGTYSTKFVVRR